MLQKAVHLTPPQGYISTGHMKWFLEAEGSRNYEDEDTLNALLRKLDTNGDGQVAALLALLAKPQRLMRCKNNSFISNETMNRFAGQPACSDPLIQLTVSSRSIVTSWSPSSSKSRRS